MQRYYRAAKIVRQVNVILLQNLHARLFPIADRAGADRRRLRRDRRAPARARRDAVRAPAGGDARRVSDHAAPPRVEGHVGAGRCARCGATGIASTPRFRRDKANRARFIALLRAPRGVTHELRRMNLYGILGQVVPPFGRIVGQMQHDLFHVYTVDEHILMVIRNLRRFTESQHAHEYPLCSRLISDFEPKEVLYLAGLFHDIAKGRGGDHSTLGAADARRFCRAHGRAARGHRARRLAGRAAPVHVLDGAEAGPVGSQCRRGVRRTRRHGTASHRALSADGRRHSRHEPEGVERVEGAAARGFVSPDARAARGNAASTSRSPTASSPASAKPSDCCGSTPLRTAPSVRCGQSSTPSISSGTPRTRSRGTHGTCTGALPARRLSCRRGCRAPKPDCRSRSICPTRSICSPGSADSSGAADCRSSKPRSTRPGTATRSTRSPCTIPADAHASYRDAIQIVEFELAQVLKEQRAARAAHGRPREPAPAPLSANARGADLSRRPGNALHPRNRRRRPAGAPGEDRVHARPGQHQHREREDQHAGRARRGRRS